MDITLEYVHENYAFLYDLITSRVTSSEVGRMKVYEDGTRLQIFKSVGRYDDLKTPIDEIKYRTVFQALFGLETLNHKGYYTYPGILSLLKQKSITVANLLFYRPRMTFFEGRKLMIMEDLETWTVVSEHRIDFDNLPSSR